MAESNSMRSTVALSSCFILDSVGRGFEPFKVSQENLLLPA